MDRRTFNRRMLVGGGVAAATGVTSMSLGAVQATSAENPAKTAPAGGAVRHLKLYAEKLADGQLGYGFEKGKASVPGPLIEITEGDTLHIEFENTTDVDASLHVRFLCLSSRTLLISNSSLCIHRNLPRCIEDNETAWRMGRWGICKYRIPLRMRVLGR